MRRTWGKLGGQLGLFCVGLGLLLIGLAWNGAAGLDFVSGQIPYLLSGGALGLALIVLGGVLVVVQSNRRDRVLLEAQLRELNTAITRLASAVGGGGLGAVNGGGRRPAVAVSSEPTVAVGRTSFHRPECRMAQGKGLPLMSVDAALDEGLTPCRICDPAALSSA
jgi:hypothetical protein